MSEMNTKKVLELLGLTSPSKMRAFERMEGPAMSSEESANEMLNRELFGTPAKESVVKKHLSKTRSAREGVVGRSRDDIDAIADDKKERAKKMFMRKRDDADADRDYQLEKNHLAKESEGDIKDYSEEGIVYTDIRKIDDGAILAHFDYFVEDFSEDKLEAISKAFKELGLEMKKVEDNGEDKDDIADESVATEGCGREKESAKELLVETSVEAKFPENFTFDEVAFADDYGIDKETITCTYIPEDSKAQVAEHILLSFNYDDAVVALEIYADGRVRETVDAEETDAQFTAEFKQEEREDGTVEDVLVLDLIEEANDDDDAVLSEEDVVVKSEGDEVHIDEKGNITTPEFIEEAGLNLDPFYSKQHGMKVADKGVGVAPASMANESLAARIIKKSK